MLKPGKKRRKVMSEINVVPYIDVMLVLLVIFMVTAPMLSQGVNVDLPQAEAKPLKSEQEQEPIIVSVDKEGRYFLNIAEKPEESVGEDYLMSRVAAKLRGQKNLPVYVKGDKNVNYGQVVSVMVLLQTAGAPTVGLITETPENLRHPK